MEITKSLLARNLGEVIAWEPNRNGSFTLFTVFSLEAVLEKADILVVLVDHNEFKAIDPKRLKEKVVIDTRGIWR